MAKLANMNALYRNRRILPSLLPAALLLAACDQPPVPRAAAEPLPNAYLEAVQQAEALKHEIGERDRQQRQIDELLGRGQAPPR